MPLPAYIWIAEHEAFGPIVAASMTSGPYETGGLLVGRTFHTAEGLVLLVVGASGPGPNASLQTDSYAPDLTAHQQELGYWQQRYAAFNVDYVGEWHKHPPDNLTLSEGDNAQALAILANPTYVLPNGIFTPLVVVVDGEVQLHGYYYPRETPSPHPVRCAIEPFDLDQSLADFQRFERIASSHQGYRS